MPLAGPYLNTLDHTLPIASILDIPLISSDPNITFIFKNFYPHFRCHLKNWSLPYIVENFSTVFYGFNIERDAFQTLSFRKLINQSKEKDPKNPLWDLETKFIYHFHGCSDKRWFRADSHLTDVDQIFFYGDHMIDLFKSLDLYDKIVSPGIAGNYRKAYYLKNKDFFDTLAHNEVFSKFKNEQFTILYAPTWQDRTNATSIFKAYSDILDKIAFEL